jgi:hypothetical protein
VQVFSVAEKILFVVEGAKTERQIVSNINKHFFRDKIIHVAYEAEVYQLGQYMRDDPYLDLFEVLKERNEKNRQVLAEFSREDFSQIYMFFDYDGQASKASDDALTQMLGHFGNETEHGKLYVSYPMVEALKHLNHSTSFEDCVVAADITGKDYKHLVSEDTAFQDLRKITEEDWRFIIQENMKKAELVATGHYRLPTVLAEQISLLAGQLQRYKTPSGTVAVLSAFPLFLREYFGSLLSEVDVG